MTLQVFVSQATGGWRGIHIRDDIVELVGLDDLLSLLRDIAGVDRKDALRARLGGKQRQDTGSAADVHNHRVLEGLLVRQDELRVARRADLVVNHNRMDVCDVRRQKQQQAFCGCVHTILRIALEVMRVVVAQWDRYVRGGRCLVGFLQLVSEAREVQAFADKLTVVYEILLRLLELALKSLDAAGGGCEILWRFWLLELFLFIGVGPVIGLNLCG